MTETKELKAKPAESGKESRISDEDQPEAGRAKITQGIEEKPKEESGIQFPKSIPGSSLPWLVSDFQDISDSVYEAVMIAAARARQIGRRQKQEIDDWYKLNEPVDGSGEEQEESNPGVDHFEHPKPTVKALEELTSNKINFNYPEDEDE